MIFVVILLIFFCVCDYIKFCCVFCDFIKFCCVFCDFLSSLCVFCDFTMLCCFFAMFCCVLVVKISLFLRFRFGFIVDNNFLVLIPLFCAIKLIISLDSSIVNFKRFKSIDFTYISQQQNAQKNDLKLTKIGYFLGVKICLFLLIFAL